MSCLDGATRRHTSISLVRPHSGASLTQPYALPRACLLALAAGKPDPGTARTLLSAQTSTNNLLAAHVLKALPASESLDRAAAVLSQAQDLQPLETAVLCHEAWLGSWIARSLEALKAPQSNRIELQGLTARIESLAAVAALRAGIDTEITTMAINGCLLLPTLGLLPLSATGTVAVRLIVRDGVMSLHLDGDVVPLSGRGVQAPDAWLAMRRLTAAHGERRLELIFDDLDPLRDCFGETVIERVPEAVFAQWRQRFSEGWRLLCAYSPERAVELSQGMRTLVPVAEVPGRNEISVTSQDAMGALAMTMPADPAGMAIALVHEQAHSALNGLLNLGPLFDRASRARYFAPWRPDPRPIGGLLHGTYAFLAVTETWLEFSAADDLRRTALDEFALRRAQLAIAIDTLENTDAWTPMGREFLAGLRLRCDALLAEPVPANNVKRAEEILRHQRRQWLRRNRG